MTIQGDLSTLQLADLLQSLENGAKSGLLGVHGPDGERRLYFKDGKLALFASEGRPALVEVLVACGVLSEKQLEAARRKRRGTRRSLGQTLVEERRITADELRGIAEARLLDEACELVAAENEAFRFEEGPPPRGVFDPEERRLDLAIASGPLLMESARREDHWRLIRARIPSDSAHYLPARDPGRGPQAEAAEPLREVLLARLDGTRSVAEAMARFPHQRFEAYRLLAELVEAGSVRMARPEDMLRLVREHAPRDARRAWELLERALARSPQDRALLVERALVGEDLGQLEEAAEALKILAHLHLEHGERDEARRRLDDAKRLVARDAAVWERSFQLALEQERFEDAERDGRHLAELYRSPGLHRKAWKVFETLARLAPDSFPLASELARSQADSGEPALAIEGLEAHARRALERADDAGARQAFEEILRFDAGRDDARLAIERIDAGEYARRRERRRRRARLASVGAALLLLASVAWREAGARRALAGAEREIARGEWIEARSYLLAVDALEAVRAEHPWTSTALFDVPRRIGELEAKLQSGGSAASARSSAGRSGASGTSDR